MPSMRHTRGSAMGIPRVLPQRIFLPSSPAHAREQLDEKFQPSEIIEHLANDFNERTSDVPSRSRQYGRHWCKNQEMCDNLS